MEEPISYEVDRLRGGRSFTARQVTARQRGEAILVLSASFHDIEAGTHCDDGILTSGRILDAAGRRIATVAQEILARAPEPG